MARLAGRYACSAVLGTTGAIRPGSERDFSLAEPLMINELCVVYTDRMPGALSLARYRGALSCVVGLRVVVGAGLLDLSMEKDRKPYENA
jgi:hypothetical protein